MRAMENTIDAHDALVRVGAQVLGVVVNDVPRNGRYGYFAGDGYYDNTSGAGSRKNKRKISYRKPAVIVEKPEHPAHSDNSGSLSIAERRKVLPVRKKIATGRKETADVYNGT